MELCKVGKVKKVYKVSQKEIAKAGLAEMVFFSVWGKNQCLELSIALNQFGQAFRYGMESPKRDRGNTNEYDELRVQE